MPKSAKPRLKGEKTFRPPYLCWFESDFQGNQHVRQMEPLARLMYRSLLCASWNCDEPPYLRNDDAELMHLADAPDRESWERCKAVILARFQSADGNKLLFHPKTLREFERAKAQHERAVRTGAEGGAKRWNRNGSNGHSKPVAPYDPTLDVRLARERECR